MERIVNTELGVIREPLRAPFGFKGGTLSELWQTAVRLTLDSGASGMGVGVQSVLWSDPVTFCACDEAGGNERMLAVTRRALELLQGQAFTCWYFLIFSNNRQASLYFFITIISFT